MKPCYYAYLRFDTCIFILYYLTPLVLVKRTCLLFGLLFIYYTAVQSQTAERPTLQAGRSIGEIAIDGLLDEEDWQNAPVMDSFLTTEPVERGTPSAPTLVRVIVTEKAIFIGVECKDPDPDRIVRFSKLRDTDIQ